MSIAVSDGYARKKAQQCVPSLEEPMHLYVMLAKIAFRPGTICLSFSCQVEATISQIVGTEFERLVVRRIERLRRIERRRIHGPGVKIRFALVLKSKPADDLVATVVSKFRRAASGSLPVQLAQVGSTSLLQQVFSTT